MNKANDEKQKQAEEETKILDDWDKQCTQITNLQKWIKILEEREKKHEEESWAWTKK